MICFVKPALTLDPLYENSLRAREKVRPADRPRALDKKTNKKTHTARMVEELLRKNVISRQYVTVKKTVKV